MQQLLELLAILLTGGAAAASVFTFYRWRQGSELKHRVASMAANGEPAASARQQPAEGGRMQGVITLLSRLSLPEEGWQNSGIRLRFLQAGIRNRNAPIYYYALKTLLTIVFPVLLAILLLITHPHIPFARTLLLVLCTAALGYYLPELLLGFVTNRRIDRMRDSLPDMIDLMVICTESGMSIDAATARISQEMAASSPDLAEEFHLSALEMRAGATRIDALRNLALRSRLEDLDDLVSMLVQADRFGTSLADSLRVQSDMMRTRRTQRAEELAAKIPVKMVLPLVLFIFPTLMLVMLGPAGIQIMQLFKR